MGRTAQRLWLLYVSCTGEQCTAQAKDMSFGILTLLPLEVGFRPGTGLWQPARQGDAHNRWWQQDGEENVYSGDVKEAPDVSTKRVLWSHDTDTHIPHPSLGDLQGKESCSPWSLSSAL